LPDHLARVSETNPWKLAALIEEGGYWFGGCGWFRACCGVVMLVLDRIRPTGAAIVSA
jgi:hypothetical protein